MSAPERIFPAKSGMQPLPLTLAALQTFDMIIDVRSPDEYALDHIPGALNFPVLDNTERAEVGTIYKQVSAFEAKIVGAVKVARNIATHIDSAFAQQPKSWKPMIYCWRGGARSGAMSHILRSIGWQAQQLEGGYKAWRRQVIHDLEQLPLSFQFLVICGQTGSGKSRLLQALAESGRQVLDLERLAAHKGSVLGELPREPQPSQKMFESLIWKELSRFDSSRPVYVEAESKRVGSLRVPDCLINKMRSSPCFELRIENANRVRLLMEEYTHFVDDHVLLSEKLDCLKGFHSHDQIEIWKQMARDSEWEKFVADMLVNHYDPAYKRSMFRNYVHADQSQLIKTDDISNAGYEALAKKMPI